MPPRNCERAVFGLMIRPHGEDAEHARDADLAGVGVDAHLDELRAEARASRAARRPRRRRAVSTCASVFAARVSVAARLDDRRAPGRRAHRAAGEHRLAGSALSPISTRTRSSGTSSASAAICVSTVRAPVPMSAAAMRTMNVPSASARAVRRATARGAPGRSRRRRRCRRASGPSRRARARALRPAEPLGALAQAGDEVAASRTRLPRLGVDLGLVADPQLDRVEAAARRASSSIADSSANMPGHSPGARIHDGVGTSSATRRCVVRRFGAAYIIRVTTAVCSANSCDASRSARRRRARSPSAARRGRRRAAAAGSSACGSR